MAGCCEGSRFVSLSEGMERLVLRRCGLLSAPHHTQVHTLGPGGWGWTGTPRVDALGALRRGHHSSEPTLSPLLALPYPSCRTSPNRRNHACVFSQRLQTHDLHKRFVWLTQRLYFCILILSPHFETRSHIKTGFSVPLDK